MIKSTLIKIINIISYLALAIIIIIIIAIISLTVISRSSQGLTPADRDFMAIAYQEAALALPTTDYPVGAVLVIDGQVIAKAHNTVRAAGDSRNHAEMLVINDTLTKYNAGDFSQIKGRIVLYTTLEPCPMCEGYLVWKKIPRVVVGKHKDLKTLWNENILGHLHYRFNERGGLNPDQQTKLEQQYSNAQTN